MSDYMYRVGECAVVRESVRFEGVCEVWGSV